MAQLNADRADDAGDTSDGRAHLSESPIDGVSDRPSTTASSIGRAAHPLGALNRPQMELDGARQITNILCLPQDEIHQHSVECNHLFRNERNPAVNLPNEIIVAFLSFGLGRDVSKYTEYYKHTRTITSVCHRWRDAALGDSNIWTIISYRADRTPRSDYPPLHELARRLELSKSSALQVHFHLADSDEGAQQDEECRAMLLPHFERIQRLDMIIPEMYPISRFLSYTLSRMVVLGIRSYPSYYRFTLNPEEFQRSSALISPPNLKSITFSAPSPSTSPGNFYAASTLDQLSRIGFRATVVRIAARAFDRDLAFDILQRFSNVEVLCLSMHTHTSNHPAPASSLITFPNLKRFQYYAFSASYPKVGVDFVVPQLDTLHLAGQSSHDHLIPLQDLSGSLPCLRTIIIRSPKASEDLVLQLGKTGTAITSLRVTLHDQSSSRFFQLLSLPETETETETESQKGFTSWPSLNSIEITFCKNEEHEHEQAVWEGFPPLELVEKMMTNRLSLELRARDSEKPIEGFKEWAEEIASVLGHRFSFSMGSR